MFSLAVKDMLMLSGFALRRPRLLVYLLSQSYDTLRGFQYAHAYADSTGRVSDFDGGELPRSPNRLRDLFDSNCRGRGIWKWLHYFDIYDRHLSKFVGRDVRVVEVGVYSGGSLAMWRNYFGDKCHIYGIDIEPACISYENECTDIFIGDQEDRGFWRGFKERVAPVDILIDDGGHSSKQQMVTLEEMLPHVKPGGVYICEDVHGIHKRFGSFVQATISNMNEMHLREPYLGNEGGITPTEFQGWIHSAHFYPYLVVLEKAESPARQFRSVKKGTEWQPFFEAEDRFTRACR
jgi:hypothetical protein